MERSDKGAWRGDGWWLLAWGIASSIWCVAAAGRLGATFDEPIDLARGLDFWRTGSHRSLMKVGAMPLPMDLDTLPLYLWERWTGSRFDLVGSDLDGPLPWARAGTLVFWWLLLGYGWLAGRAIGGRWAGRLAVALLACEPSLLAHAGLATKDIAVSACLLALVYHFRMCRASSWWHRVGLPAFWFAAAVLAKASGLVFGPLCLLAVELERLARAGTLRPPQSLGWRARCRHVYGQLQSCRQDGIQIVAVGLVLVFIYCGSDWQPEPSFVAWTHRLPDGLVNRSLTWLAEHLGIFSNAGEGLVRQVAHNIRGHGAFLLGETDPRAFWYYFPVALTMKLTPPLLVLPFVLLLLRPRTLANWACVATAALLLFSLKCRVQIGIRLVLPLVVLAVVGLAAAVAQAGQEFGPGWRRRLLAGATGAGVLWTALAAVLVWPHGLCYVNEFWGGTRRGYLCLSDSNYDWGQGLKELASWRQRRRLDVVDVWYFGTDPAIKDPQFRYLPLHSMPVQRPEDVTTLAGGHYLAVSTTLLFGVIPEKEQAFRNAAAFLHTRRPVDRTTTFLIYDFTREGKGQIQAARADQPAGSVE